MSLDAVLLLLLVVPWLMGFAGLLVVVLGLEN